MVIEWLKAKVAPELREKYIQLDAEVWTAAIAQAPGYLGKEVWINPDDETEIIMIIRWASREQWKSFPLDKLAELERTFDERMGAGTYTMVEEREYHVRKFPAPKAS
jgi:uncharacterized protein (TIGR03792 family)